MTSIPNSNGVPSGTSDTLQFSTQFPASQFSASQFPFSQFSVHVVLVIHEETEWLSETLASLANQEHRNLLITIAIPADPELSGAELSGAGLSGPDEDSYLFQLISSILPQARILSWRGSFPASANAAMLPSNNAVLHLFCRPNVALPADALGKMIEKLVTSNSGIVAPKLVNWDNPDRLESCGYSIDKTAGRVPVAVSGELDQGQHDHTQEVFGVTTDCLLMRTDLLEELGGFDEIFSRCGEDLDLCWRVHLVNAQVVLQPEVAVRLGTVSSTDSRTSQVSPSTQISSRPTQVATPQTSTPKTSSPLEQQLLEKWSWRYRLFSVLTCYSSANTLIVAFQAIFLTYLEATTSLLLGQHRKFLNIASGWWWNLARPRQLLRKRHSIKATRAKAVNHVHDTQMFRLQSASSSRHFREIITSSDLKERAKSAITRKSLLVWLAFLLVLGFGSRHLLTRGVTEVGSFADFPNRFNDFFAQWFSSLQGAGLGSDSFSSLANGLLGFLSVVLLGATGLARTLIILGPIPLGALGMIRLLRNLGSKQVGWTGAAVYLALPLPYNALTHGSWETLLAFGAMPWLAALLMEIPAQIGTHHESTRRFTRRFIRRRILVLGMATAFVTVFVPFTPVLLLVVATAIVLGALFVGDKVWPILPIATGAALVAALLSLPHFGGFFSWTNLVGVELDVATEESAALNVWELLRFATGPISQAWLGWALILAAALPLLVAREARFVWGIRGWSLVCASVALAWAQQHDLFRLPSVNLLLVPAGLGFAVAAAMGLAALESDLPRHRFGWRQTIPFLGVLALVLVIVPVLSASLDGRWNMSKNSYASTLEALDTSDYRVLWVGHPDVLPNGGYRLTEDLGYILTVGVDNTVLDSWVLDPHDRPLRQAVEYVRSGRSNRLGRLLTPMGIRYVAVLSSLTPPPNTTLERALPNWVEPTLRQQLDMRRVDLREGLLVYENISAVPIVATVKDDSLSVTETFSDVIFVLFDTNATGCGTGGEAGASEPLGCAVQRGKSSGSIPAGSDIYIASGSDNWGVSGVDATQTQAFGWAQVLSTTTGAQNENPAANQGAAQSTAQNTVTVSHSTPVGYTIGTVIQLLIWISLLFWLAATRSSAKPDRLELGKEPRESA